MAEVASKEIQILGEKFVVNTPFVEGHTCTAAEAKVLNQTRGENLGNQFRPRIKALQNGNADNDTIESIQADFAERNNTYEFTLASVGGGSRTMDPVEKEARKIARDLLADHLAKDGRKIGTAPDGETKESWKEKTDEQIANISNKDAVIAQAKKNVEARKKSTAKMAEEAGISL